MHNKNSMSIKSILGLGFWSVGLAYAVAISSSIAAAAIADSASMAQATPHIIDWDRIIEKGGTVAILIWMLLYFQKRLEVVTLRSEAFADKALSLLEKASVVMADVSKTQSDMRVALVDLTNRLRHIFSKHEDNQDRL